MQQKKCAYEWKSNQIRRWNVPGSVRWYDQFGTEFGPAFLAGLCTPTLTICRVFKSTLVISHVPAGIIL